MTSFCIRRGYPPAVVNQALQRVKLTPPGSTINSNTASPTEEQSVPLVLTYHPQNTQVREIMKRNFALRKSDSDTSLQITGPTDGESGTFPCGRPRCVTCAQSNPSRTVDTPGSQLSFEDKFTCTTSNLIYVI